MGKIIAIANQKGGVGKTTTAVNLSACLADRRKRVLLIDLDPQGNATSGLGLEKTEQENTVYELLLGECSVGQAIRPTLMKNLSIIPSDVDLAAAEIELIGVEDKENLLKNEISRVADAYDYVIIDCPPSLNILTINAMTTANSILVPIQCEYYALEGLSQLMHTVELIQERINDDLTIEGVLFTMYDGRTNLAQDVVETVRANMDVYIFKNMIPRNVRLAEAPSHGLPIHMYDSSSTGAKSYKELAKELIKKK